MSTPPRIETAPQPPARAAAPKPGKLRVHFRRVRCNEGSSQTGYMGSIQNDGAAFLAARNTWGGGAYEFCLDPHAAEPNWQAIELPGPSFDVVPVPPPASVEVAEPAAPSPSGRPPWAERMPYALTPDQHFTSWSGLPGSEFRRLREEVRALRADLERARADAAEARATLQAERQKAHYEKAMADLRAELLGSRPDGDGTLKEILVAQVNAQASAAAANNPAQMLAAVTSAMQAIREGAPATPGGTREALELIASVREMMAESGGSPDLALVKTGIETLPALIKSLKSGEGERPLEVPPGGEIVEHEGQKYYLAPVKPAAEAKASEPDADAEEDEQDEDEPAGAEEGQDLLRWLDLFKQLAALSQQGAEPAPAAHALLEHAVREHGREFAAHAQGLLGKATAESVAKEIAAAIPYLPAQLGQPLHARLATPTGLAWLAALLDALRA